MGSPFGRPQWLARISLPPLEITSLMDGSAATIRVSSVTTPSLSGTLKSTRIRTFLPARSISLIVFLSHYVLLLAKLNDVYIIN